MKPLLLTLTLAALAFLIGRSLTDQQATYAVSFVLGLFGGVGVLALLWLFVVWRRARQLERMLKAAAEPMSVEDTASLARATATAKRIFPGGGA